MLEMDTFKCALEKIKSEVNNDEIFESYQRRLSKMPCVLELKKQFPDINKYIESLLIFDMLDNNYRAYKVIFKAYENTFNPDTYKIIQSYVVMKDRFLTDHKVDENDPEYIKFKQFVQVNAFRFKNKTIITQVKPFEIDGNVVVKECYEEENVYARLSISPTRIPEDFPKVVSLERKTYNPRIYYLKDDMDAWLRKHACLKGAMKYELENIEQLYSQTQISMILRNSLNKLTRTDFVWRYDIKDIRFLSFISKEKYPYPALEYKTNSGEKITLLGYEAFYALWTALCKSRICAFNDFELREEFNQMLLEKGLPVADKFKFFKL